MKKILILLSAAFVLVSFTLQGDAESIIKGLKTANVEQVSSYFDSFIDLKLPEKDEVKNMGKNQAGIALKSFFSDNGIKGFELSSQREMGGTMYMAGKLQNAGKGFNITVMMKKQGEKNQIITIRIN